MKKIVTEQISPAVHKPIKITYVPVTVQTRFQLLDQQAIDMECGSTTVTLERMKQADFFVGDLYHHLAPGQS